MQVDLHCASHPDQVDPLGPQQQASQCLFPILRVKLSNNKTTLTIALLAQGPDKLKARKKNTRRLTFTKITRRGDLGATHYVYEKPSSILLGRKLIYK